MCAAGFFRKKGRSLFEPRHLKTEPLQNAKPMHTQRRSLVRLAQNLEELFSTFDFGDGMH
jgi:hypothetical protein